MPDATTPNAPDEIPTILEHLPVVVYVDTWDQPVPQTIYISPNVEEILGYPPSLYLESGERWLTTVHPDDLAGMREELAAYATDGAPYELTYRFVHPDGRDVWVHDRAIAFVDPVTGESRWMGALHDISARVHAQRAHETSTVQYAALLENLPAVVYEMDPDDDRRTRYVNRKIEELLGYTMEEWLEQPDMWTEVLHPDDREVELAAHDQASRTGEPWQREYRLIGAEGDVVWVRDHAVLLRDAEGEPLHWQGVMVDITTEKEARLALAGAHQELEFRVRARTAQLQETNELMGIEIAERRRAEEERLRAESHLGYLMHNLPAVIYLWQIHENPDGSWLSYVGDHIAQMLGYSAEEWDDDGWRARVHPHDREMVEAAATHSIETGEPFQLQYRYLARDGRVVWVVDHATLQRRDENGESLLFEGVMIDVTDMREAERKAEDAEDRLREIVERGPIVLYAYSLEGDPPDVRLDYLSRQLEDLLGVSRTVWQDDPMMWFEMIHPDDRARMLESSERTWRTGEGWRSEYRVIAADGSVRWLADHGTCVARNEEGRPQRFVGAIADITERRAEMASYHEELTSLRDVTNLGPAIAWTEMVDVVTGRSRYSFISANVASILGFTAAELMVEPGYFERILHPDDLDRVVAGRPLPTDGHWDDTFRVLARDGSVRWLQAHARRASPDDENPQLWHGVTVDVTHLHPAPTEPHVAEAASEPLA